MYIYTSEKLRALKKYDKRGILNNRKGLFQGRHERTLSKVVGVKLIITD